MADRTEWKSVLLLALLKAGFKLTDKQKKSTQECFVWSYGQGSHSFTEKNPGLFQDFPGPHKNFSRTFTEPTNTWISRKIRKNNHLLTLFKGMVHCSKQKLHTAWSTLLLTLALQSQSDIEWTYFFSITTSRKMCIFQGFFQDFPGPKWFSRTFQVLEF